MKINDIYNIGRKIGQGSFGNIYKAKHSETNQDLAVKMEKIDITHP